VTGMADRAVDCHVVRPDRAVVALARRQHGAVTAWQLGRLGWSADAIAHRVATGWLVRVHRGVYLVGPVASARGGIMAAALACGRGAWVSHGSAAVLWSLPPAEPGEVDVLVAGRNVRSRRGIRVHRTARLHPADATRREGIPVTSLARTLLDLATTASPRQLVRAVEEAQIRHHLSDHSLDEQFRPYPHHPGVKALKQATLTDPTLTRSEAERKLVDLIRKSGLPPPETNTRIAGHEVDAVWRARRLVVEVDGYAYHGTRAAFERDRRRDADLQAAGLRVLRITWRRLQDEPLAVVAARGARPRLSRRPRPCRSGASATRRPRRRP
jgi:very-short-patch-repair endonuclease